MKSESHYNENMVSVYNDLKISLFTDLRDYFLRKSYKIVSSIKSDGMNYF